MKYLLSIICASLLALSSFAGTTYSFLTSVPLPWTSSAEPRGYEDRGSQFETSTTLTLSDCSNITQIDIVASATTEVTATTNYTYTMQVFVGETQFGSTVTFSSKVTDATYTFSGAAASGDINVYIVKNGKKKSVYISSITVEGTVPPTPDPVDRLDHDYIYPDDPIIILPKDSLGKMRIDTVVGNILIQCNQGAFYKTDIRVAANGLLTITATQPIKAIKVDGWVRKSFSATADVGDLEYMIDDEDDAYGEPVLMIKNINNTTVNLHCNNQLQMQQLYIYFKDNPDDIIGYEIPDEIFVSDAMLIANTLPDGGTTTEHYIVYGYVAKTDYVKQDTLQTFYMTDTLSDGTGVYSFRTFECRMYTVDDTPAALGDYVGVYGRIHRIYDITLGRNIFEVVDGYFWLDEAPTALEDTFILLNLTQPMYDLSGRRVGDDYKGVVIQNSRKYLRF